MPAQSKNIYEFGEFRLDTRELILLRGDEPVEITPKGFELLCILVENQGRLLEKEELMEKIWSDSFVEEGSLTFNIRQLRIILGDDAHEPKYIKTVRRHGYRFIADVRCLTENAVAPVKVKKSPWLPVLGSLLLLAGIVILGAWYFKRIGNPPEAPVLTAPFALERLSTNGKVALAVLSPDGKRVVYVNGTEKQSVWLRQLEGGSNTEIIPESDEAYLDLAFAPDGSTVYFSRRPQAGGLGGIYRISVFGGIPQKIISDVLTTIALSPDGKQISFVRYQREAPDPTTLRIADSSDGANERQIISLRKPFYIRDLDFSADGKRIAFAAGQYNNTTNEADLSEVELESGARRTLTNEQFFDITRVARLPDGSGWLIAGSKIPVINYRIWNVSARGGAAMPLTREAEIYDGVSLDKEAAGLVATQVRYNFHIRLFPLEDPAAVKPVEIDGDTIGIGTDGRIYFTSLMSGNAEIWSANADGSSRRQLTNNKWEEDSPIVSPAGDAVFFTSIQTGKWLIWRINPDGSNQTQVTSNKGGIPEIVTPDGEWLYFTEHDEGTLWRVSLKNGEEQPVLAVKTLHGFAVLPDASQAAYLERQGEEWVVKVTTLADGKTIRTFHLADKKIDLPAIAWTKDEKNLVYVTSNAEPGNKVLWIQPLDSDTPRRLAELGDAPLSASNMPLTPDGKFIAIAQGSTLHDAVLLKGLR